MFKKGWQPKEYKGVQDEIHQQHLKAKDMSFKGKLSYFWYYYKIHTIAVILIIIFGVSFIHNIVTAKDYNFYGIMLNAPSLDGDAMEASFGEYAGLDMENYDCFIDTMSTLANQNQTQYDIATFQRMVALVQSKDLDVLVTDAPVFINFSFNGMMMDLRDVMTEEELARYEGQIYYLDNAEVRKAEAAEEAQSDEDIMEAQQKRNQASVEDITAEAETHRHPETMEDPIPVGIFLDESPLIQKTGCYGEPVPIYGISVTSQRTDTAKKYLDYLWDETIPFDTMITSN